MNLPDKAKKFLAEYEVLCRKYGLMVLSDGEPVTIGAFEEGLWGIEESTENWINRYPANRSELL